MTAYEAIHKHAAWLDLSHRGRLIVTGEDAARLLHAICTNDVKNLVDGAGLYAFFLTAQGRIIADANIYNHGGVFWLDTEPETAEKLREHLDRYIIADDAAVEHVEGWGEVAIEGPQFATHAVQLGIPVPEEKFHTAAWEDGFVARVSAAWNDGLRVFAPEASVQTLIGRVSSAGLPQLDREQARIVRLENGIPRYGEDITERYLAQETGQLQAVHFNKGCYLGQEIVERVRSRAQVHRHLRAIRVEGTEPLPSGTKLAFEGKDAAEITSSAYSPELGEIAGLAYVRTDFLTSGLALTVPGTEPVRTARVIAQVQSP